LYPAILSVTKFSLTVGDEGDNYKAHEICLFGEAVYLHNKKLNITGTSETQGMFFDKCKEYLDLYLDVYVHGDDRLWKFATSTMFTYLSNAVNQTKLGNPVYTKWPVKAGVFFTHAEFIA